LIILDTDPILAATTQSQHKTLTKTSLLQNGSIQTCNINLTLHRTKPYCFDATPKHEQQIQAATETAFSKDCFLCE
jgi:hypothetical protein